MDKWKDMKQPNEMAQNLFKISLVLLVVARIAATANLTAGDAASRQQDDLIRKKTHTSARSGRMLDLDVLAGDMGKEEKAAKERSLSGNRQSRILNEDIKLSESDGTKVEGRSSKKNSKKMSIKGFIPIVSLDGKHNFEALDGLESEESGDNESGGGSISNQNEQQNNLRDHLSTSYGGQTSIGHASFAPSPPSNHQPQLQMSGDQASWQQYGAQAQDQQEAGRARKLLGSSSILSGLTSGPRRSLISSLVPAAPGHSYGYGSSYPAVQGAQFQQPNVMSQLASPMNMPSASQQPSSFVDPSGGECICVPFFQCKNGFLSESQLSKSQLMQLSQFAGNPVHQIPRSLDGFKSSAGQPSLSMQANYQQQQQQANDLYTNYLGPQQTQSMQASEQMGQQPTNQQQQQQQQLVNDIIYDQLRKSIESSNLEQQLQQQAAYNQANQQPLSLIDERNANANANTSSSAVQEASEAEWRSLLNPLSNRRQYQGQSRCGIMRTCCRTPPRSLRAARPLLNPAASRFVNVPQQQQQLVASPSITRAHQTSYQMLQPARVQPQPQHSGLFSAPEPVYQSQPPQNQLTDVYQTLTGSSIQQQPQPPLPSQQLASLKPQPSGSFMQGRCGMRQTLGISGRVQNADGQQQGAETSAEFGEFPAHAAILRRLSAGESLFVCSAVLISSQWLATAAHCLRKSRPEELKVRLGEWDVNRDDEFYPFFESNVREIVLNADFQPTSLINDIALIRLENPVEQQQMPHIAPACLATPADGLDQTFQFNGQRCWVAGWGKDAFGQQGTFQSVLKKVDLPVVSRPDCELALKYQTKLGKHFRLHSGNICAGGERGKDACEGDGGAGLYCVEASSGLIKAVGLVSWGVGCGQRGVPGVYVNLAQYTGWIEQVVAASGEQDVYMDARAGTAGVDAQAFKSIISERSNHNATASPSAAPTTTSQPPATTLTIGDNEARHTNGTQAEAS